METQGGLPAYVLVVRKKAIRSRHTGEVMEVAAIARKCRTGSELETGGRRFDYFHWKQVALGVVLAMQGAMPAYAQDSMLDRARQLLSKLVVVEPPQDRLKAAGSSPTGSLASASDPYAKVIQAVRQIEYRFPHGRKTADGITMEPELGWAGLPLGAGRHELEQIIGAPLKVVPTRIDHGDYAGTESTASIQWKGKDVVLSFDGSKLHAVYVLLPELRTISQGQVAAAQQGLDNSTPKDGSGEALVPTCQSATLFRTLGRLDVEIEDCD